MDTYLLVLAQSPLFIAVVGAAVAVISLAAMAWLSWGLTVGIVTIVEYTLRPFSSKALSPSQMTKAIGTTQVTTSYTPVVGAITGTANLVTATVTRLIDSLGAFATLEFLYLLLFAALAGVAVLYLLFMDAIGEGINTFYQCYVINFVYALLWWVNLANLLLGMAWGGAVNSNAGFSWLWTGVPIRVAATCSISNGPLAIEALLIHLGDALFELGAALTGFMETPDLLYDGRFELNAFFAAVGEIPSAVITPILDCMCEFLSFVWTDALELTTSDSLHEGLTCTVNAAVKVIQMVGISIDRGEPLQWDNVTIEVQCATLHLSDVGGEAVALVIALVADIVDLIPVEIAAAYTGTSESLATVQLKQVLGEVVDQDGNLYGVAAGPPTSSLDAIVDLTLAVQSPAVGAAAETFNLSDVLGLRLLVRIAETPWPRVISHVANGGLALANNTLNLFLLATRAESSMNDVQYFQVCIGRTCHGGCPSLPLSRTSVSYSSLVWIHCRSHRSRRRRAG